MASKISIEQLGEVGRQAKALGNEAKGAINGALLKGARIISGEADAKPEAPAENEETASPVETGSGEKETQPENATLDFGERLLKYQPGKRLMAGADVNAVQSRLLQLGYDPGAIDGKYGPLTAAAVSAFQAAAGIKVDGIVGPITRNKLTQ